MKTKIIFIAIFISIGNWVSGQNRTIYGRVVVSDDLTPIPGIRIKADTSIVGNTDAGGRFKASIPKGTQSLSFLGIGLEPTEIKLNNDCDTIEVVMMGAGNYDFMSSRSIDRLRLKDYKNIPKLHLQAYKKGLFTSPVACYSDSTEFKPLKPKLDSIGKRMAESRKRSDLIFKRLKAGDTIRIAFSGQYRADGTDRVTLNPYTNSGKIKASNIKGYDCIVKCTVVSKKKNGHKHTVICKMIDCSTCKYPSVYNGRAIANGEVLNYNMGYLNVMDTSPVIKY